jgi:hypothetical protein
MKMDPASLEELKRICAVSYQKNLSDDQVQDVGQRIIRFLKNSLEDFIPDGRDVDAQ